MVLAFPFCFVRFMLPLHPQVDMFKVNQGENEEKAQKRRTSVKEETSHDQSANSSSELWQA